MSRHTRIQELIHAKFFPTVLKIEDESKFHHVPQNMETHFKITIVSDDFSGLTRVARHRLINHLLQEELNTGLHALSLHLYTAEEWVKYEQTGLKSPPCQDGYKNK